MNNEILLSYWHNATGPVQLTEQAIKQKFIAWLRRKDLVYLSYFKWILPERFIKSATGLNGSATDIETNKIEIVLMDAADQYKEQVKLKKFRYLLK